MKKTNSILCAFVLAGSLFGCSTTQQKTGETDYTQYVNTFIGAADNGHTFPGACRPFGMIQTSPVTGAVGWRYCSEYVACSARIADSRPGSRTTRPCLGRLSQPLPQRQGSSDSRILHRRAD